MNSIELLVKQTQDAYSWFNKILERIDNEKWDQIPDNINSNVTWQVGHMILSHNFHSLMVIRGHQKELYAQFPIKLYSELFVNTPPQCNVGKTDAKAIYSHLKLVQDKTIEIMKSMKEEELTNNLEPTKIKHPIATNKYESLDWNIKHTMWHAGQLGMLKRVLGERYDFGLKL